MHGGDGLVDTMVHGENTLSQWLHLVVEHIDANCRQLLLAVDASIKPMLNA